MATAQEIGRTAALGLSQIVAFASSFYLLGVLGDPIAESLSVSPRLVFDFLSGAFLVSAFVGPFAGRWINARGGREALMAASVVFGSALTMIAFAREPIALGAGVFGLGLGMAIGLYGTPNAILVEIYGETARPWITAVALMGGLGSSVGWIATHFLLGQVGWRGACLVWAGAHMVICLPLVAWLTPPLHARGVKSPPPSPRVRIAWDGRMTHVALLFAGAWFVSTCISAHLPRLLTRLGLSTNQAVGAAAFLGVAAVSARAIELIFLRRVPSLITARIATLLHPLGALAVLALGPSASLGLVAAQGVGNGMLSVANGTLPLALFGRENYAYRTALLNTPAKFVQAAGPALFGIALSVSPAAALAMTGTTCLVMFAMTFGLTTADTDP
jgi:predicted MFS family arabinose efflux permease